MSVFYTFLVKSYTLFHLVLHYLYDFFRYISYSATLSLSNKKKLEGRIIAHYHVIEKGLSNPEMRYKFGKKVILNLIKLIDKYIKQYSNDENTQVKTAISAIQQYLKLHDDANIDLVEVKHSFEKLPIKTFDNSDLGGIFKLSKQDILRNTKLDFKSLALSRYSIRDFSNDEVDIDLIKEAVKIAQKSPSVCNRQSSKVYLIKEKQKIKDHLFYQNGNRGFGHKINKLLVLTSDLNLFEGPLERNQAFIDGGIFAMSLLYAVQYLGLGAVALNWCVSFKTDKKYKKQMGLSQNETIIMMIGIGHLPEYLKVPISNRRPLEDVLHII